MNSNQRRKLRRRIAQVESPLVEKLGQAVASSAHNAEECGRLQRALGEAETKVGKLQIANQRAGLEIHSRNGRVSDLMDELLAAKAKIADLGLVISARDAAMAELRAKIVRLEIEDHDTSRLRRRLQEKQKDLDLANTRSNALASKVNALLAYAPQHMQVEVKMRETHRNTGVAVVAADAKSGAAVATIDPEFSK